jgi:hypothetical protein
VPETGIEPVRPLSGKRRILSPLCLPISPLGHRTMIRHRRCKKSARGAFLKNWRRGSGSNRRKRLCRPLHNHFATPPWDSIVTTKPDPCCWPVDMPNMGQKPCPAIKKEAGSASLSESGAGEESRTLDLNLGKVALYQLSYSRINHYNYHSAASLSHQHLHATNLFNKKGSFVSFLHETGAGEESRTLDLNLGKVALYQLSYSRVDDRHAL